MPFGRGFSQLMASSQFYLTGRKRFGRKGWENASASYPKPDVLSEEALGGKEKARNAYADRVFMVTGANSGVGFEVAKFLALHGGTVHMVCRSADKAEAARQKIVDACVAPAPDVRVLIADVSLEADVRRLWTEFSSTSDRLDALVCNAGALLNNRTITKEGVEVTFGAHLLFGTYLLGTLARPTLARCPQGEGRMVVVSSGGMYNTKWPGIDNVALTPEVVEHYGYDGQFAYAACKRGQVLLCERWGAEAAAANESTKFVSCHPGWTETPGVDAAYGEKKSALGLMRTPWQGAEGIAWLCVAANAELESGAFYLDRQPQTKHLAGAFFTEGSLTKNTTDEVDGLMKSLKAWSSADTRPGVPPVGSDEEKRLMAEAAARRQPLTEQETPIDLEKFTEGKWYVHGNIPTFVEKGITDAVEEYVYDKEKNQIDVTFTYRAEGAAKDSPVSTLMQRAFVKNSPTNTRWAINPKFGFYLPLGLSYLVVDCAEDYSMCTVAVPSRDYLWIMGREKEVDEDAMKKAIDRAVILGFDNEKIVRVQHSK